MTADLAVVERDGTGIVQIMLNRPERRNALNAAMWRALAAAVADVASQKDDRVVILTGAGSDFCTGGDLTDADVLVEGAEEGMRRAARITFTLAEMAKPTIAAVRGRAIGGGLGLALACDLVVASETAAFWPAFGKRGMTLDCGASWSLVRLTNLQQAKRLVYLAEPVPVEEAERLGLVAKVVPDADLEAATTDFATRILDNPPEALALNKALLNRAATAALADALDAEVTAQLEALEAPSFKAAIQAYLAGRPAHIPH